MIIVCFSLLFNVRFSVLHLITEPIIVKNSCFFIPLYFLITATSLPTYILVPERVVCPTTERPSLFLQQTNYHAIIYREKAHHFIETMEREELCEFITEAARIVGLKSEEDITEEWREW
jgi:hypothetical protein